MPEIVAEPGSLVNATFPAPVAARANTCQRIVDVIIGALAKALPDRKWSGRPMAPTPPRCFPASIRAPMPSYVYLETLGGGFGGRADQGRHRRRSGPHHQHLEPAGRVHRDGISAAGRELRSDRGFRRRGPLPRRARLAPRHPAGRPRLYIQRRDRAIDAPALGDIRRRQRAPGQLLQSATDGTKTLLANQAVWPCLVHDDETIVVESPGAGGYGPPAERSADAMTADQVSGKFSKEFIDRLYRARRAAE